MIHVGPRREGAWQTPSRPPLLGETRPQVVEFNFLRANAQEPLATFLEYITYEYMIENVMMLLKGTLSGRDVNELIEQCHPMVSRQAMSLRLRMQPGVGWAQPKS